MSTYDSLTKFFNKELWVIAQEYGYSESNILILQNDFQKLQSSYPQIWQNLESCTHKKDNRSIEEYAMDLVSSWVYEDTILKHLENTFTIKLSGGDKKREILPNNRVSSDSDFEIIVDNHSISVELMNSYTNHWKKKKKIDLRDDKFKKLQTKKAILICIDIYNNEFYFIDLMNSSLKVVYIPSHPPYGYKPVSQIDITNQEAVPFTVENLISAINDFIKGI